MLPQSQPQRQYRPEPIMPMHGQPLADPRTHSRQRASSEFAPARPFARRPTHPMENFMAGLTPMPPDPRKNPPKPTAPSAQSNLPAGQPHRTSQDDHARRSSAEFQRSHEQRPSLVSVGGRASQRSSADSRSSGRTQREPARHQPARPYHPSHAAALSMYEFPRVAQHDASEALAASLQEDEFDTVDPYQPGPSTRPQEDHARNNKKGKGVGRGEGAYHDKRHWGSGGYDWRRDGGGGGSGFGATECRTGMK